MKTVPDASPILPPWLRRWRTYGVLAFGAWGLFFLVAPCFCIPHATLGLWGDSFAPLTGLATVLAVVFTAWSVHMQSEQLKGMAADAAIQRKAQDEELALSRAANKLTRLGHLIEARRQVGEIDRLGAQLYRGMGTGDGMRDWLQLVHAPRSPGGDRQTALLRVGGEMNELVAQREELGALIAEWNALDPPSQAAL